MKICLINNLYGPQARGGAEKVIKNLAQYLVKENHEVVVIAGRWQKKISEEQLSGVRVIYVPSQYELLAKWSKIRKLFFHIFGFFNIKGALRIKKIINKNNFDLVWTNNLVGLNLLSLAALGQTKKIHTFHDLQLLHPSGLMFYQHENILNSLSARIYQFFSRSVFPSEALGIFPSNWLKEMHAKYKILPKNNLVLNNPTNNQILNNKKISHEEFIFLYAGQIEEHKGVDLLIKAFTKANLEKAKLIIAGDGSLLKELQENNLNKNITFLGRVEKIPDLMLKADCLVIPSICYENMPMVLIEAKEANLAIIGSNLGGLAEALGETKLLFEPILEALADKLNWCFLNQAELKNAANLSRQKNQNIDLDFYFKKISEALKIIF